MVAVTSSPSPASPPLPPGRLSLAADALLRNCRLPFSRVAATAGRPSSAVDTLLLSRLTPRPPLHSPSGLQNPR